jgi:hypothetical protein
MPGPQPWSSLEGVPVVAHDPVADSTDVEQRLRELLHDPGWSLPAWPDPAVRVAGAARRQRIRTASLAAIASAAVAVMALSAFRPGAVSGPPASAYALPAVGAGGFPASIYPAADRSAALRLSGQCPDPAGLELTPPAVMRAQTAAVVEGLGTSFRSDLASSDRAYWPQIRASWRSGAHPASGPARVLYSGALESRPAQIATPGLARAVRTACGNPTARNTWLIVTGQADKPAEQTDYLLLDRSGRVLVWDIR